MTLDVVFRFALPILVALIAFFQGQEGNTLGPKEAFVQKTRSAAEMVNMGKRVRRKGLHFVMQVLLILLVIATVKWSISGLVFNAIVAMQMHQGGIFFVDMKKTEVAQRYRVQSKNDLVTKIAIAAVCMALYQIIAQLTSWPF